MNKKARFEAWKILVRVFQNQGYSHVLLNQWAQKETDQREKNFVFQLVHGTLTWQPYLNVLAKKLINPKKTPLPVQVLIWLSLYQIYLMDRVPNYAVVNEAVEIAKQKMPRFAKLVNATLQNALRTPNFQTIGASNNPEAFFALSNGFPPKIYQKMKTDFGSEIARKIVLDSTKKPLYSFRINTLKTTPTTFLKSKEEIKEQFHQGLTSESFWSDQPLNNSWELENGWITIQDQASILVGSSFELKPEMKVWDMCAAPGGKLTHLAALMQNQGKILATEINEAKIPMIQSNLDRLGVKNVELISQDALDNPKDTDFDAILLDAPCSGLGVLKRKPEIKINFDAKTLNNLISTQSKLLNQAAKHLKKDGILVYSTCTINRDENQNQIAKFLETHSSWELIEEKQLFGFEHQTDGFYIAKLQKK